jgi:hypothetical protein
MSAAPLTSVRAGLRGRGALALIAAMALVILLLVVAVTRTPPPTPIPYDLDAAHPQGLLALRLWLAELGYDVRRTGGLRFQIPDDANLLFVYPNRLTYDEGEAQALRRWVEAGHTLVLVGPQPEDSALADAFGVRLAETADFSAWLRPVQPLLPDGAAEYPDDWLEQHGLDLSDAPGAVVVLADDASGPEVAVQRVGEGVVWHLTPGQALTNEALRGRSQGELLPAFLRFVPAGSVVVFDAYHLFGASRAGERIATLQDWLYRTPTGWATLAALLAVAAFLVTQGRRLGPAVASPDERRRREAAEFVRAMAGLYRRAHVTGAVARHQRQRLKRGLGRRWPLSLDLDDASFVARLAAADPPPPPAVVDAARTTLAGLTTNPHEHDLVRLSAEIDRILKEI